MSRVGKNQVVVPEGVNFSVDGRILSVKGKLGELTEEITDLVKIEYNDNRVSVIPANTDKDSLSQWGLVRSLINNMVVGVEDGFTKTLEVNGVGYRAATEGDILQLQLGYSHDIKVAIPKEITVKCSKPTEIVISGASKQKVGQFAAEIRALRKPEPYKGKGVRYSDEYVRQKEGKKK
ncbi:MAG: 50S ribosomal protein L6 [Pelagibacterales bacterium]|nr:50S ribosomal protein L6 [Pelagibacterales bacterium]PPR15306.1 MAG: 50S ribosomal protein L6 [Alphaproteobacteria bacterium MarineAlpha9_Bin3]|tara:strand:+ start:7311 stop:7844 length:534 start_codon:yes stop_codon:yes gene_type:complete